MGVGVGVGQGAKVLVTTKETPAKFVASITLNASSRCVLSEFDFTLYQLRVVVKSLVVFN